MNPLEEAIAPQVRAIQIIVGALMMGVIMFGAVVASGIMNDQPPVAEAGAAPVQEEPIQEGPLSLEYIGYGFAGLLVPTAFTVFPIVRKNGLKQVPSPLTENIDKTLGAYQASTIVGAAMLESAAFVNLTAYMIEGAIGNLAVAGVMVILIATFFPTVNGVANWFQDAVRERTESDSYRI